MLQTSALTTNYPVIPIWNYSRKGLGEKDYNGFLSGTMIGRHMLGIGMIWLFKNLESPRMITK